MKALLVHGNAGSASVWRRVVARLPPGSAHAIDLPGFGDAWYTPPPEGDALAAYVGVVEEAARKLGEPVVFAGAGVGSILCAHAARRLGEDALGVVMTGPVGLAGGHARISRLATTKAGAALVRWVGISPLGRARFLRDQLARPEDDDEAARILREALVRARGFHRLARLNRPRSLDGLAEMPCPVEVLWGELDQVLPVAFAEEFVARVGSSTLDVLAGAAHALPLERPDLVAEAIAGLA